MGNIAIALVLTGLCAGTMLGGEERSVVLKERATDIQLTGNAMVDFRAARMEGPGAEPVHKSPWLAAGLSVAIPGTGELYAESYWKAAGFFLVEVVAWTIAYTQDVKGDRQTDAFQNFADQNWSVVRYAQFSLDNFFTQQERDAYAARLFIPGIPERPQWEQVHLDVLNEIERKIGLTEPGRYYSHTLPDHGDQQYYELIGKYPQYNQGWNDATASFRYGDPLTPNFRYYSTERGKANDFYSHASTAVTVALINHVLSAIDAAWSASSFNRVQAHLEMDSRSVGHRIPVLKLVYSF